MKSNPVNFRKYFLVFFSISLWMAGNVYLHAQPAFGTTSFATAGTVTMAANAPCTAGQSGVSNGYRFTVYSGANCSIANVVAAPSDGHINLVTTPTITGVWQEGRIGSSDGMMFKLDNFVFSVLTTPFLGKTITVTGYQNATPVPGATAVSPQITATGLANTFTVDVSANAAFGNINEFRLVPSAPADAQGTLSIQSVTISPPLPIELLSFEGKRKTAESILLNWQTASETNNKVFEVQQSTDAENFTTVAYVNGQGNSTTLSNYQLSLNNANAVNYRLKQVDYDGKFSYSKIIYVEGISSGKIKIAPNPVKDRITLIGESKSNYQVSLVDILGNPIGTYSGNLSQIEDGLNTSVLRLTAGLYLLKFAANGEWQVQRFIKVD